jgi:hypothetical protein
MQANIIRDEVRETRGTIDGTMKGTQKAGGAACCASVLLTTCCEPSEKESCCGVERAVDRAVDRGVAPRSCGCQDSSESRGVTA